MSKIDTTVLHDGQLAVATVDQSGTITKKSAINTNILVQTEDGEQLCVATYPLNGGGGGGGGADTDLSNLTNTGQIKAAHLAMPSNTYDDLTLGASGTEYTAPADGWFVLQKMSVGNAESQDMANKNNGISASTMVSGYSILNCMTVAAKKGDVVLLNYYTQGTTVMWRFVYAVGSESEQQGA